MADMPVEKSFNFENVTIRSIWTWRRRDATVLCEQYKGLGDSPRGIALIRTAMERTRGWGLDRLRYARFAGVLASAAIAVGVSGCGMSSLTSGFGGSVFGSGSSSDVATVSEDQLLTAAMNSNSSTTGSTAVGQIEAGCPRFIVASRDNNITFYEPGRAGDSLAIMQRGEITKTARECYVEPGGRVTVKYGFSGRVLLGPKGQPGPVSLPVVVSVNDSKRARVTGENVVVNVNIEPDKPIGYFSAVRTVTFDVPEGSRPGEFELVVGFDQKTSGAG